MGRTVADCRRMMAVCESAKIPMFVAHVLRFFPEFAGAKAQVDAGAVGNVAAVRTRRGGPFPHAWENWYAKLDWSGGLTLDLAIHDFDWLRWTLVRSSASTRKGSWATSRRARRLTSTTRSRRFGSYRASWRTSRPRGPTQAGSRWGIEIAGDEGLPEYNFDQPSGSPFVASVAQTATGGGVAVPESPVAVIPYQLELAHFLDSLERGVPAASLRATAWKPWHRPGRDRIHADRQARERCGLRGVTIWPSK